MANRWICLSDSDISIIYSLLAEHPELKSLRNKFILRGRIKISSAKKKGRELQKWVCKKISELIGLPYDQQDDGCLIHSREMGQSGTDIVLRGFAQELFPFSVECKSTENISLPAFIKQAKANQRDKTEWMVVIRSKQLSESVVVVSWEGFEKAWKSKI